MQSPPTIRLYTERSHYSPEHHHYLLHILRPLLTNQSPAAWLQTPEGTPLFELVSDVENADACVLPMTWNYYVNYRRQADASALARLAADKDKVLLVMAAGDHEPVVPIPNAVVFHPGPTRSVRRAHPYAFAHPSFVPDYRQMYFNGEAVYRRRQPRAVVGFCGHGASPWHKLALNTARNIVANAKFKAGRLGVVPEPVTPAVLLRARVLRSLQQSAAIDDRFIIRNDYRAGVRNTEDRSNPFHPTRVEFVNAINDCDYTVCIRGGGNFSVRLYETLTLGRIPIFIDTDCILPYDFVLDWRQFCCWVSQNEIPHIAEKVADFHASLSPDDFVDLQKSCRAVWEQWFSEHGFHRHFYEHLRLMEAQSGEPNPETTTSRTPPFPTSLEAVHAYRGSGK